MWAKELSFTHTHINNHIFMYNDHNQKYIKIILMSELNHMARKQSFLLSFLLIFHSNELCLYIYVCVYYVRALLLCVCVFVSVGMNLIMDKSWLQEKKGVHLDILFLCYICLSVSTYISFSLSLNLHTNTH